MNKEELEMFVDETLDFDNVDEAFEDFIYDFTIEEVVEFLTDKMKEEIIKTSPSYIKHNGKWYFNGEFQELEQGEIKQIIKAKEKRYK